MHILAIDIGGTKSTLAAFELTANGPRMVRRETWGTDLEGGREAQLEQLHLLLESWRSAFPFEVCGIGFGGPVDYSAQRVALSTHVAGWSNFPLRDYIQSLLGIPTVIENDANAGALGEALFGAGRGARPLFYVTLSTGIGGGLIVDGDTVHRGADGWAGEIGHLTVRPDGPECLCGARGCLERMCSGLWLARDYGRPPEVLLQDANFVRRYVVDLSLGLKAAIMLLNPARIVIGGGIAKAGDALFVPLREELRRQVTPWSGARLDVVQARAGDDSVLWGALELARRVHASQAR